ncbi:MAG: prepilin peptidase [Candidatus Omnitrophota bacterium]|nr:prepilin peptidase [Candidatus Omnitrophota bacterium]
MVGSFLNVCIYRMPKEESIVKPGSHCPNCSAVIYWFDNIPILSYIILMGRCRFCKKPISPGYPIVELLTAITFLVFYNYFGLTFKLFVYLLFVSGLIVATFVDIAHRIIPDEISIGGIIVGFILSIMFPHIQNTTSHFWGGVESLLGILIGGVSIYLTGIIGDWIFKKESMGGGDVKLLAMIGAFLGWRIALLTFFLAPLFGAVVGIIVKIKTKQSLIPYGPFLSLAAVISLFYYQEVINWIFGYYRY